MICHHKKKKLAWPTHHAAAGVGGLAFAPPTSQLALALALPADADAGIRRRSPEAPHGGVGPVPAAGPEGLVSAEEVE